MTCWISGCLRCHFLERREGSLNEVACLEQDSTLLMKEFMIDNVLWKQDVNFGT